jgi:hypothetical protein
MRTLFTFMCALALAMMGCSDGGGVTGCTGADDLTQCTLDGADGLCIEGSACRMIAPGWRTEPRASCTTPLDSSSEFAMPVPAWLWCSRRHAPAAPPRPKRKTCTPWPEIPPQYRAYDLARRMHLRSRT